MERHLLETTGNGVVKESTVILQDKRKSKEQTSHPKSHPVNLPHVTIDRKM